MSLTDFVEAVRGTPVFKTKLPQGVRKLVRQASIETEEDLDLVDAEERRAKERASKREYYLRHKADIIAKQKARRHANPAKARAERKAWRLNNPDKARAIARRLARIAYAKNPDKYRAKQREMHVKHRERRLAYMREYHAKNREIIAARRLARKLAKEAP